MDSDEYGLFEREHAEALAAGYKRRDDEIERIHEVFETDGWETKKCKCGNGVLTILCDPNYSNPVCFECEEKKRTSEKQ